ncbi:MAG: hypothetical protein GXP61_07130 [Epsilonproteobacteria bacterium]|nr:hypothetical protein [Campylobacterota bacterium]
MEEIVPNRIELIPKIKGTKCKFYLLLLYIFITYTPMAASLLIWYEYNFLIGFAFFLFFTLAMGVVISKLRLLSLPPNQMEMSYSNMAIAKWFLDKNICY